jgi:hypothetical protein
MYIIDVLMIMGLFATLDIIWQSFWYVVVCKLDNDF